MRDSLKDILRDSKIVDNYLYLPNVKLDRKEYLELNKEITALGGAWKSGKISAFVFNFDPKLIVDKILNQNISNIKKSTQFFPTPTKVVNLMLEQVQISESDEILEPSAGQGAIILELIKLTDKRINFCEIEEVNIVVLNEKCGKWINQVGNDFLKLKDRKFDKIIANPPFSKSQDIDHIKHMYELLNKDGVVVSLSGTSWKKNMNKKSVDFRDWLSHIEHRVIDLQAGEFSESGTQIQTCIIVIHK